MKRYLLLLIWITLLPVYGYCQISGDTVELDANLFSVNAPEMQTDGIIGATGYVQASGFIGDGSALTNVPFAGSIEMASMPSPLNTHATDTTAIHGVGVIVGTTETQDITNKTITGLFNASIIKATDTDGFIIIDKDGNLIAAFTDDNRVGIGTTSPTAALKIMDNSATANLPIIHLNMGSETHDHWIGSSLSTGRDLQINSHRDLDLIIDGAGTGEGEFKIFQKENDGTAFLAVKIDGNVGIGTTSPDEELDVNGRIIADDGIIVGASSTNNLFDDSSNGSGSTTMYIGNLAITASFSAGHDYKIGEAMETGDAVVVEQGGAGQLRIKLATNPTDHRPIGIVQMIPRWIDSTGDVWVVESTETIDVVVQGDLEIIPQASAEHVVDLVRFTTEIIGSVTSYAYSNGVVTVSTSPLYATETYQATQLISGVEFNTSTGQFTRYATSTVQEVRPTGIPLKAKNLPQEANAGTYAYRVIMYGDTYEDHTTTPLEGAKLSVHNGNVGYGSPVTISDASPGWLMLKTAEDQREIGRFLQNRFGVQAGPLVQDTTGAFLELTKNLSP